MCSFSGTVTTPSRESQVSTNLLCGGGFFFRVFERLTTPATLNDNTIGWRLNGSALGVDPVGAVGAAPAATSVVM